MRQLLETCIVVVALSAVPGFATIIYSGDISPVTNPSTWTGSTTAYIGNTVGDGTLTITNGTTVGCFQSRLGCTAGLTGTVTVTDPGSAYTSQYLTVGDSGNGIVTVKNGAALNCSPSGSIIMVGSQSTATGSVTVDGAGSTWTTTSGNLVIGRFGSGTLTVTNGGVVTTTGTFNIAYDGSGAPVGAGKVFIDGPGSNVTSTGGLIVATTDTGNGLLKITNGGYLKNNSGNICSSGTCTGTVILDGTNSEWDLNTYLAIGNSGTGTLDISGGAKVAISGTSNVSQCRPNGVINIGVESGSALSIATYWNNSGTVRLLAGAGVAANSAYTPITAGTWSGTGAYTPVGGTWDGMGHVFTASTVIAGVAGAAVSLDPSVSQRMRITDTASGGSFGVSVAASDTASTIGVTASPISNSILSSLSLGTGESILGDWTVSSVSGYSAGSPAYLSIGLTQYDTSDPIKLWSYRGGAWSQITDNDLTADGRYASFTTTAGLTGLYYAVSGVAVTPHPGDANGDGTVDILDLNRLLTNFDKSGMAWSQGDFDGNGVVDILDLNKLLTNFDKTFTSANVKAVPEPGVPATLMIALAGLLAWRWTQRA